MNRRFMGIWLVMLGVGAAGADPDLAERKQSPTECRLVIPVTWFGVTKSSLAESALCTKVMMGYLSGVKGASDPEDKKKEQEEEGQQKGRQRRRAIKLTDGLAGQGPEALDIRFDPARTGLAEIDANLAKLARTCTIRDVKWWYPKGIETRVDFGDGLALRARPLSREFGPDGEGVVQFSLEAKEGKGDIRLKISAPEGISVSTAGLTVSTDADGGAKLLVRVTGRPERFTQLKIEAQREGVAPMSFPVFLIIGEKTISEAKGSFSPHPSETDPNWSLFGKK